MSDIHKTINYAKKVNKKLRDPFGGLNQIILNIMTVLGLIKN